MLMTSSGDSLYFDGMEVRRVAVKESISRQDFVESIQKHRQPVVIEGLDLGPCIHTWTPDYLAKSTSKPVKIHVAPQPSMDFISKNFLYRTLPFDQFVHRAAEEEHAEYFCNKGEFYYLRSVGEDARNDIADLKKDFPNLAGDLHIPDFFEVDQHFSTVFRIASKGTRLWTHYDIMDNILIQVSGRKQVVLFSPQDANFLYLVGDKSAVIDIDNPDLTKFPCFSQTTRWQCFLNPGDVIFIPALWFHNVVSLDFGIAVNVFWRHLEERYYNKKDPYGNKDLVAGERALQAVDRALSVLSELPGEYRDFYARRMVINIENKGYKNNDKTIPDAVDKSNEDNTKFSMQSASNVQSNGERTKPSDLE